MGDRRVWTLHCKILFSSVSNGIRSAIFSATSQLLLSPIALPHLHCLGLFVQWHLCCWNSACPLLVKEFPVLCDLEEKKCDVHEVDRECFVIDDLRLKIS